LIYNLIYKNEKSKQQYPHKEVNINSNEPNQGMRSFKQEHFSLSRGLNLNNETRSNKSCSSYGKNYILKSNICKSTKPFHFNNANNVLNQDEGNMWLNYYGGLSKELSKSKRSSKTIQNSMHFSTLFVTKKNSNGSNIGQGQNKSSSSLMSGDYNFSVPINYFKPKKQRETSVRTYEDDEKILECEEENKDYTYEDEIKKITDQIKTQNSNVFDDNDNTNLDINYDNKDNNNNNNSTTNENTIHSNNNNNYSHNFDLPLDTNESHINKINSFMNMHYPNANTQFQNTNNNNTPNYYTSKYNYNPIQHNQNFLFPNINPPQQAHNNQLFHNNNNPPNTLFFFNNPLMQYPFQPHQNLQMPQIPNHMMPSNNPTPSQQQLLLNQNLNLINYSSYNDESLAQLSPYIIKEQNGCRFIQDKVIADPLFANNTLFPYLIKDLLDLICDSFGNYLFQILVPILNKENFEKLVIIILPNFFNICISSHGTRVIQKIIEKISLRPSLFNQFNLYLQQHLLNIAKDSYGNHVIQKYLSCITYPDNELIFNTIKTNMLTIVNSKHGCCVIQKAVKEGHACQKKEIMKEINKYLFEILANQFGNFAIQYILTTDFKEGEIDLNELTDLIGNNIVYLGKQKYSANVLEKCFENSNMNIQMKFADKILERKDNVEELVLDTFGNYVIQKCLLILKGDKYNEMLHIIAGQLSKIKQQPFGNKLISKLLVTHKIFGNIISSYKEQMSLYS
jgi:hypothetical protein